MREVAQLHLVELLIEHHVGIVAGEQRAELVAAARVEGLVVPQRVIGVERHEFDHAAESSTPDHGACAAGEAVLLRATQGCRWPA